MTTGAAARNDPSGLAVRTPHHTPDGELDERRLQVIADQAAGLRWQIVLTALVVVAIVWRDVPALLIASWWVAVVLIRELRARALQRLVHERDTPIATRLDALTRWNLLLGASNGAAALMMGWLDTSLDAVLTMILVSWGAGAVSTSSTVMRAFVAYAAPVFVPTAAMWAATLSWFGSGVAVLVLMFFGVQTRFARRNLETFEESFRIRQENEALARHLAAERGELARARDAAEEANREKSRFLAAASHDLRQPLQAIALNCGELTRVAPAGAAHDIASEIGASAEHLRTMLEGLLDLSKLDAGAVPAQVQPVRLDVMIPAIVAALRAAAAAKGLRLSGHCPPGLAVQADADLLRRLLANLADNAIKFTAEGAVEIIARPDGATVSLEVRDTGPGIAPADQQRIFDDLVQLPAAARRPAGHGLGLGIVRRAAALMGTAVEVQSAPGQGAVFRCRLPIAAKTDEHAADLGSAWSLEARHILVVDDDDAVRQAYATALAGQGARVETADGPAALDAIAQRPDAAVVDWRLGAAFAHAGTGPVVKAADRPDSGSADGFVALQRLRQRWPDLAAVVVTADLSPQIAAAARQAGVALLRKPVGLDALGRAVADAITAADARPDCGSEH